MKLEFSGDFRKKNKISASTKIRPAGAELFHADRRIDRTKLKVALRHVAIAIKKKTRPRYTQPQRDAASVRPFNGSVVIGFYI
jgi:hypothetical protein